MVHPGSGGTWNGGPREGGAPGGGEPGGGGPRGVAAPGMAAAGSGGPWGWLILGVAAPGNGGWSPFQQSKHHFYHQYSHVITIHCRYPASSSVKVVIFSSIHHVHSSFYYC